MNQFYELVMNFYQIKYFDWFMNNAVHNLSLDKYFFFFKCCSNIKFGALRVTSNYGEGVENIYEP